MLPRGSYRGESGFEEGAQMADISKVVDKDYEGMDFDELADAPVDALEGLSKGDAEALQKAFNIKTIRQLAESKYVLRAQGIVALATAKK
jgi:hypothetical protein